MNRLSHTFLLEVWNMEIKINFPEDEYNTEIIINGTDYSYN